jgi:hypothetical protein
VNASIPRCIHVLPAHGKAVLHLSKREKVLFGGRKKAKPEKRPPAQILFIMNLRI